MLKQLTATGIAVAGITGAMLLASPANAESFTVKHNGCYAAMPYLAVSGYCNLPYSQYPGYNYYPGGYNYYPGHQYGWGRWHHHRF